MRRSNVAPIKRSSVPGSAPAPALELVPPAEPEQVAPPELVASPATQEPANQMSALLPLLIMGGFLLVMIVYGALSH